MNSLTIRLFSSSYRIVEKSELLSSLVRKGGIRFKLALVMSMTLLVIIVMFILIFTGISSTALMSAHDKLCQTIAGTISSTEPILISAKNPLRRSLMLQDILSGLANKKIDGLEYAAVYDLMGKIVERKESYAAHTDSTKRSKRIPYKVLNEIKDVNDFQKEKVVSKDKNNNMVSCLRYRLPFTFFNVKVGVIEIVFSEESILGPIKKARTIIFLFSFALLLMGIGISVIVATGMVHPIKQISYRMIKVREGDLEIKMHIGRHDELGVLNTEFNHMIVHLREKLQMQKFVSERTVSMIREQTASGNIGLGGTRKNLAFLFTDIRGFTAMSEKMEPEDVVTILNEYLDLQAKIIKKNNGDIDKYVGDEVMAVFSGDEMADNAIECAIEIIDQIKKLNKNKDDTGLKSLNVGIGLNLGNVIQGRMGSRDRMDNTCIGDTVNLAARLCSQAESGAILASKNIVLKSSKGKFTMKKLEPIRVKGKADPVEIYSISRMK